MRTRLPLVAVTALGLACGGCGASAPSSLPAGPQAYTAIPEKVDGLDDELIRAGDQLAIRVLGEPELTSDQYRVTRTGYVQIPLAGEIIAEGRKPAELRDEIARRLGERYLRNPQVSVNVASRQRTTFAVEGQVREPGLFEVTPDTTLLSAIAQAKSPTNIARLSEVAVLREVGGKRYGARFDLKQIRAGSAPDPQIIAGDTIVVGYSPGKAAFRDVLGAAPLLNFFYLLR